MIFTAEVTPIRRLPPNINSFTYEIPEALRKKISPGSIVLIPLHGRRCFGVVIAYGETQTPQKKLKEIIAATEFSLSREQLLIARTLSNFYLQSLGVIFNSFIATPAERATPLPLKRTKKYQKQPSIQATQRHHRGYVLYSSYSALESLLGNTLASSSAAGQTLIITPDQLVRNRVKRVVSTILKPDNILFVPRRSETRAYRAAWEQTQTARVLVGTLSSLLLPFSNLKQIIVVEAEHHLFQSAEQNPRYHLADILFPAADTYRANVLVTGFSPDIELLYQIKKRSWPVTMLKSPVHPITIHTIGAGSRSHGTAVPYELTELLRTHPDETTLILYNRTGASHTLACLDCRSIPVCPMCGSPFNFDEQTRTLQCRTDNTVTPAPHTCPSCKGTRLNTKGHGINRIARELNEEFPDRPITLISKAAPLSVTTASPRSITIATNKIFHTTTPLFDRGIWLLPETDLTIPGFHTAEQVRHRIKKFQGMARECSLITAMPEHPVLASLPSVATFFKEELQWRKKFSYPPFGTLYKGIIRESSQERARALLAVITKNITTIGLLGPYEQPVGKRWEIHFAYKPKNEQEKQLLDDVFRASYNGFHLEINPFSLE